MLMFRAGLFPPGSTMKLAFASLATCAALGLITSAHAGVTVTLQGDKDHSVIYVEGNKMRIEGERGDAHHAGLVIYDGDQQKMFVIDQEKKTYNEMTPQSMK